ncbi:MAG TPA: hypothetical protein VGJ75_15115, partial [Dongiaceae bacterium]
QVIPQKGHGGHDALDLMDKGTRIFQTRACSVLSFNLIDQAHQPDCPTISIVEHANVHSHGDE